MKRKHKIALGASIVALSGLGAVKAQASSVQEIANAATPVATQYGLYPSVMIAQGILESNFGQSDLATNYNNLFGVKYTSGLPVYLPTQEFIDGQMMSTVQPFQAYDSLYSACVAQAALLRGSTFYAGAWRENTSSYLDATAALQGRYATDPDYASKLNALIAQYGLTAYDGGVTTASTGVSPLSVSTAGSTTYTVQAGDNLSTIAAANGTTVAALMAENNLSSDLVKIGQILQIGTGAADSGTANLTSTNTTMTTSSSYSVQAGDTLSSIAAHFGLDLNDLLAENNLTVNSTLLIGQTLQISSTASPAQAAPSTVTYVVQAGDTLSAIAAANATSPGEIMALNGITNSSSIFPGQTLQV